VYNSLQLRELFHLEFLRWFGRKVEAKFYSLKGGSNLRFFFNSFRYSQDMDLDAQGIAVHVLRDTVMKILEQRSFQDIFKPFGVERIVPPDIGQAKQTETTQRFKAHLIASSGEDFFTKIEFSRRGFNGKAVIQAVSGHILRQYKLPPLLIPHYDIESTIAQKIGALADRAIIQARDIFDLYILSSQCEPREWGRASSAATEHGAAQGAAATNKDKLARAHENLFAVNFEQFRDAVVSYLSQEDQGIYNSSSSWDEIKLKVADFIDEIRRANA